MASATPSFKLFGIPIHVQPFFAIVLFLLGALMYSSFGVQYVLSFVGIAAISILVHELGHALAFRAFGMRPTVVLHGMGGLTSSSGNLTPARNLVITLAGPVPPLLFIGVPALLVLNSPGHSHQLFPSYPWVSDIPLQQVVFVNLVWSVLNLIPVLPLDGGLVSASIFEMVFKGRGRQIANVVSIGIGAGLGLWALSVGEPFLPAMAAFLVVMNVVELTRGRPGTAAEDPLVEAHRALLSGQPQMAEHLAHEGAVGARDLERQRWANEMVAWSRLFAGDVYGAQQQAVVMPASRPPSQSFYGALALASGRRDEGVTVTTWALVREPAGPAKSLAVVAAARAGVTDEIAAELKNMGPGGADALRLFVQLLDHVGFQDQAARIVSGRSPLPPPGAAWPAGAPRDDASVLPPSAAPGSSSPPGYPSSSWSSSSSPPAAPARPSAPAPAPPPAPAPAASWPRQPPAAPPEGPPGPSPWQRPDDAQ